MKKVNFSPIKRIFSYASRYRLKLTSVIAGLLFVTISILSFGHHLHQVIDYGFIHSNLGKLNTHLLYVVCIVAIIGIASFARSYSVNSLCEMVSIDIKKDVFNHLSLAPLGYFDQHKVSQITTKMNNDIQLMVTIISSILSFSLRNLLMAIGAIILMFTSSQQLAVYVLLLVPIIVVPLVKFSKYLKSLTRLTQEKQAELADNIDENFSAIMTIKLYVLEKLQFTKFTNLAEQSLLTSQKRIYSKSLFSSGFIMLILCSIVGILAIGSHKVVKGELTGGELTAFIFYSLIAALSLGGVSEVMSELQRVISSAERVFSLLEIHPEQNCVSPVTSLPKLDIDIKNLSFSYNQEELILNKLNLNIPYGQHVGLVGSSGCGKTTLLKILTKLYYYQKGDIFLGDYNYKDLSSDLVRRNIILVPQEPFIFSGTIKNNIKLANPDADDNQVLNIAEKIGITSFKQVQEQGLDVDVGARGSMLSGGQKQQIAIARALLLNPPILLLDEATSSLDSNKEAQILSVVLDVMRDKTIISIAHRLSSLADFKKIIVFDKGAIKASGNHEDLYKNCSLYKKLYHLK